MYTLPMSDTPVTPAGKPLPISVPDNYAGNTPLLKQYFATRMEHPGVIVLMRVGDFYEAYGVDAEALHRELNITLTGREDGGVRVPMAGVPHHAYERYLARLIRKGLRVAIMDQVEDPKFAKGLVKRKVTRVVTPGTIVEDNMLDAQSNNYLVGVAQGDNLMGICVVDVSTGEFLTTELASEGSTTRLLDEILRLEPAEILLSDTADPDLIEMLRSASNAAITPFSPRENSPLSRFRHSREMLLHHFQTQSLRGFGCEDYTAGLDACALVVRYLEETQFNVLPHIRTISTYSARDFMVLDSPARRHLELTSALGEGGKKRTLLGVLDKTQTAMGGRLLRRWLEEPLLGVSAIETRHEAVEAFHQNALLRGDVRDLLKGMGDMERLVSRAATGMANARDLVALKEALYRLPSLVQALGTPTSTYLTTIAERLARPPQVAPLIEAAIVEEPPAVIREGGMIRPGYHPPLDRLLSASGEAKTWIANLEASERTRTGISSLKVGYNAVFGYYIEVTKTHLAKVPENYIRKQTTANAERYITPDLKEYEARVLGADEKAVELEHSLFLQIREQVAESAGEVLAVARAVSELDVLASFAEVASEYRYVRPKVVADDTLEIVGGRHPVIEHIGVSGVYIPNDCTMNAESRMYVITGPNMSGKSSYLRQVAIIVLMAQTGSFVPADSATVGVVDRIFTRVGAHDELSTGQSTFMVEMNETANILNNATARSLVILDEIGRGTSTYDGLSIAWAVAEYLAQIACKTLFATHYHHMNELSKQVKCVKNYRVAVKEQGDQIIWLRKLVPGGTDRSYGIQVARMAGIPMEVVERAKEVLKQLEKSGAGATKDLVGAGQETPKKQKIQLTLFEAEKHPLIEELEQLDITSLSPLEALMKLDAWKRGL